MSVSKSSGAASIRDRNTGATAEVEERTDFKKSLCVTAELNSDSQTNLRGNTDGTLIGNSADSLKVSVSPVSPGSFFTFKSSTDVDLTSDVTYTNLHSVSGSGQFIGATFVTDNDTVECRVVIDGSVVFDFNGHFLTEVVNKDSSFEASAGFGVSNDGKRLFFNPSTPFRYATSLLFQARKAGRKMKYQLYTYSVE